MKTGMIASLAGLAVAGSASASFLQFAVTSARYGQRSGECPTCRTLCTTAGLIVVVMRASATLRRSLAPDGSGDPVPQSWAACERSSGWPVMAPRKSGKV